MVTLLSTCIRNLCVIDAGMAEAESVRDAQKGNLERNRVFSVGQSMSAN
jgi:hypothetical protein